jgi:hypothetical protein
MNTNNSISNSLKKLLEINANSLKTFERINEAITTDQQDVPLEIITTDGTKTVYVPSFGYMKRELERLDTNLKSLAGLGKGNTRIKLPDGTYQNIITSTLKSPANDITVFNRPVNFSTKPNYFFEDFLNPLLTTTINVGGQIPTSTEKILVKRILFDSSNAVTVDYFNTNFKNKENIDYATAIRDIAINSLTYTLDEDTRDLPYRNAQYTGKFDVLKINNSKREETVDGVTTKRGIKLYALDKLTYSDSTKAFAETETLKVGDELMIQGGLRNTRYKITRIDGSTNQVELLLVEGYESIKIGADQLGIYKNDDNNLNIQVNVGFNERLLVFVKAIDPDSKILAENWSPGIGFYSNELTLVQADGSSIRLDDYYKTEVADFGRYINALKEDAIPPATQGITPDAPALDLNNFKVVQINTHLTANDSADKIKKLAADKVSVEEKIKKLDEIIVKKRAEISTKKYESNIQKDKDKNELNSLITERTSETSLYNSIVNQIQSLASGSNTTTVTPKYRVRGFWAIPEPKKVADTVDQSVVQFIIQYRYLSTSGKASEVSQLPFTEGTRQKTAVFSNWNEMTTKARDRYRDTVTGKFAWQDSLVEDAQEVNFNQLDISINEGELVEIRVKSVSEAGYPANPIYSDWSEAITIDFPIAEIDTTNVEALLMSNAAETAAVKISEELTSKGVFTHIDDSFSANEKYYAHSATSIASGFLSAEQKPISVYDKIAELEAQIASLKVTVEVEIGELLVKIMDEDGTVTVINNDTKNQIFAGYYTDEVASLTIKKGHIVTKTFKLLLENTKATKLELVSRLVGDRNLPAYRSTSAGSAIADNGFGVRLNDSGSPDTDNKISSDNYYTSEGKYDLVPIQYQNIDATSISSYALLAEAPYQSAQRRGQFVYSRFMDIANQNPLYVTESLLPGALPNLTNYEYPLSYAIFQASNTLGVLSMVPNGNGNSVDFIWTGTFGRAGISGDANLTTDFSRDKIDVWSVATVGAASYNNGLFIHKDHPDLGNLYVDLQTEYNANLSAVTFDQQKTNIQDIVNNAIYTMPITATYATGTSFIYSGNGSSNLFGNNFITSAVDSIQSTKQLAFQKTSSLITAGDRTFKMSFDANDQYLLGGRSCGAFLFLSPINLNTLRVEGDAKQSRKEIKSAVGTLDTSKSLSVDIMFQYRMTDYFGNDSSSDIGRIGGQAKLTFPNLTYTKKIGLDIFDKYDQQFSFDIEVFAKYSPAGKNLNSIRAAKLTRFA